MRHKYIKSQLEWIDFLSNSDVSLENTHEAFKKLKTHYDGLKKENQTLKQQLSQRKIQHPLFTKEEADGGIKSNA